MAICFIGLSIGLFTFTSLSRSTLLERPYFLQSITAFSKHPFGVGMGNFRQIEDGLQKTGTNGALLSIYTHNLFLEALSGVGLLSIPFLIFLISLVSDILYENGGGVIWGAMVISLLTNFMFDTSYTMPGLIWIFFITLGVFQSKSKLFKVS